MENKILKINIGSRNYVKVRAVKEVLSEYFPFKKIKITTVNSVSGVSKQPKSLKETIKGAINRAKNSYKNCDYGFGIESGLVKVPFVESGYMDLCVCAIFDGKRYYLGFSSAWEVPKNVIRFIFKENLDMNEAAYKAGLTKSKKIGSREGLVGIVTKGKLIRKNYTKEAIRMALIYLNF